MADKKKLGILVGGGPAPGINGVIGAATIEAINQGLEVVGILDGFKWLSKGDSDAHHSALHSRRERDAVSGRVHAPHFPGESDQGCEEDGERGQGAQGRWASTTW